jgi:hypothetical protein
MVGTPSGPPPEPVGIVGRMTPGRLSHAIYGGIIVTAAIVADWGHVEEGAEVIGLLIVTGIVLFVAHTYSALIVGETDEAGIAPPRQLMRTARDEVSVVYAVAVPVVLFLLAELEVIGLTTAFRLSVGFMMVFLFTIGFAHARGAGRSAWASTVMGLMGTAFGLIVVVLESLLERR